MAGGAYLVIAFFCGLSAAVIGKLKGSSFWLWFAIGAVLPVLGTLAALFYRFEQREPRRVCEECGKVVPVYQQVCTGCGRDLEFPDQNSLVAPAGR